MKYTFCKFCGTYLQILANFQQKVRNTQKGKKTQGHLQYYIQSFIIPNTYV